MTGHKYSFHSKRVIREFLPWDIISPSLSFLKRSHCFPSYSDHVNLLANGGTIRGLPLVRLQKELSVKGGKGTHFFHLWEIKSRFKALLEPLLFAFFRRKLCWCQTPGMQATCVSNLHKLHLEPFIFNIGIFIRSKSSLKCVMGVYAKPLVASCRVPFLLFIARDV